VSVRACKCESIVELLTVYCASRRAAAAAPSPAADHRILTQR